MVREAFTAEMLLAILAKIKQSRKTVDPARAQREAALAKLAKRRARWQEMYAEGNLDRAQYKAKLAALDQEQRDLEALLPPAPPATDYEALAPAIADVFKGFDLLPFEDRRDLLRRGVQAIVIAGYRIHHVPGRLAGGLGELRQFATALKMVVDSVLPSAKAPTPR
jgi:hypothetical protein